MKLAVVGASGITGGRAFDEATRRGLAPIAIGRDGAAFKAFVAARHLPADRVRIADAHDPAALRVALGDGVTHVVSAVAPFAAHGFEIARTAAELGLGYTDSSGEAGFMLRVIDELDSVAVNSGATLCTGNGASAFVGDVATRWIAPIDDPAATATLLYDIRGYRPTWGSLQSYLTSILPAGGAVLRDGKVVLLPFAAFAGRAGGVKGISGTFPDAIVISRYWRAKRLDALMKSGTAARPLINALVALAVRPAVRDLIFKLPLHRWTAYRAEDDAKSTVTAHVAVIAGDGSHAARSVVAQGVYPATGQVMVATLQAMARRSARPVGVRAASEMFFGFDEVLEMTDVRELTNSDPKQE